MKKLLILISTLAFCLSLNARDIIFISGHVTDIETNQPIADHKVYIFSNNQIVNDILTTDINGYYSDSIFEAGSTIESLYVFTYDCNYIVHDTTVSNFDNPVVVDFLICNDTLPSFCQADFIARVDSTSNMPNFYYFYDNSLGNISGWLWDFGDGTISLEQNPVHQFDESGTYNVCLSIFSSNCQDYICKDITTPNYFDLGGFAFAEDYPINNPASTGDTGIAYLYRVFENNQLMPIDTNIFNNWGYYWFSEKIEGDYLIKIGLTENSNRFSEYFPTYFQNKLKWTNADLITLNNTNYYSANVHFAPVAQNNFGIGQISGKVIWGNDSLIPQNASLENINVFLFDEFNSPYNFTFTDSEGNFIFTGLELQNYKVFAEVSGYYCFAEEIILNNNQYTIGDIILELFGYETTSINENILSSKPNYKLYPNPVNTKLNIEIDNYEQSELFYEIINLTGQKIVSGSTKTSFGNTILSVPVSNLSNGIYLFVIYSGDKNYYSSKKFIKN